MQTSQITWKLLCQAALLSAALAAVCAPAFAEKADKKKPISLEADSLRYDDVKQITIVEGAVTLTKGTLVMRGQRMDIREDEFGNQSSTAVAKPNERVFFRQKREGMDEFMEGEAERIEFDGKHDTVKLLGKAVMRRYRGTVLADESVGSTIVFNNISETLSVNGSPPVGTAPSQRVRIMLTPKDSPVAATNAPASLQMPAPALRPATATQSTR